MEFAKGQRFDLLDQERWNEDLKNRSADTHRAEKMGRRAAIRALTNMAQKECREGGLKIGNIDKRIEHIKVDTVDEEHWTLHSTYSDPVISVLIGAFMSHKPVAFTPDLIYGYIAKGFALHIKKHSEELRCLYVSHDGKKDLTYANGTYVLGSPDNKWELAFESFAAALKDDTKGTIVQNDLRFTTTTPVALAHRHVLAMEAMESYYDYSCETDCGIASVILLGETSDWEKLCMVVRQQFKELNEYCEQNNEPGASLKWWESVIMPILDKMARIHNEAASGKMENTLAETKDWLSKILKYNAERGSGSVATVTGWINALFPYLQKGNRNHWFENQTSKIEPDDYPAYHASVPFTWFYHGQEFDMRALVGHVVKGHLVKEDEKNALLPRGTLTLFPAWIILHMNGVEKMEKQSAWFS